jgi:hypothetical protein
MSLLSANFCSRGDAEPLRSFRSPKRNSVKSLCNLRTLRELTLFRAEAAKFAEFNGIATASRSGCLRASAPPSESNYVPFWAGGLA